MNNAKTITDDIAPGATPDEDEIRRWRALPRDEQLARLRKMFGAPECSRVSGLTAEQIISRARAKAMARRLKNG